MGVSVAREVMILTEPRQCGLEVEEQFRRLGEKHERRQLD